MTPRLIFEASSTFAKTHFSTSSRIACLGASIQDVPLF
jgi:hypothetical protein